MEKFSNPPISEAIFDVKIDPPLVVDAKEIEALHSIGLSLYPEKEPMRTIETTVDLKQGGVTAKDKGVVGFRFWAKDRIKACRFGLDGFTFNRLKPYDDWETSFAEAMSLWDIYKEAFNPKLIKRVALRYINIIEIPFEHFELDEYIVNSPRPPGELTQVMKEFNSRIVIQYDRRTRAIITLATQPLRKAGITSIVFDIDVFSEFSDTPFPADNKTQLVDILERLREYKNEIFDKSTTPKAKELFR